MHSPALIPAGKCKYYTIYLGMKSKASLVHNSEVKTHMGQGL